MRRERPLLAPNLAGAVAQAGVVPTLEVHALQDALRSAITTRRSYCSWDVDHAGQVVTLHSPEEHDFSGKAPEEGLAWCLVWLMAPELRIGSFRVCVSEPLARDRQNGLAMAGIASAPDISLILGRLGAESLAMVMHQCGSLGAPHRTVLR